MIYIGLPQWSHPRWVRLGIASLEEYARHFNCVEGNTTLYALPKPEVVLRWREQTTDDSRFCFKLPAIISHQAALRYCDDSVTEPLIRMSPLAPRIGQHWLQLLTTLGPRELPAFQHFLGSLPGKSNYGVEACHPQFFAKGEGKQMPNRGLHQRGVNRVVLGSRPVHAACPYGETIHDARRKKPKVPVHAVLTAKNLLIHFIGSDDMTQNRELFQAWLQKLAQWHQTTTPYFFLHVPDIAQVPELAHTLWENLRKTLLETGAVPAIPQQSSLFRICHLSQTGAIDYFKGSLYGKRAVCRFKCVVVNEAFF